MSEDIVGARLSIWSNTTQHVLGAGCEACCCKEREIQILVAHGIRPILLLPKHSSRFAGGWRCSTVASRIHCPLIIHDSATEYG